MMMIKLYHVSGTRGIRVIWAMKELGIPYEIELIDFSAEFRETPGWRSKNPVGKVPAMEDGDLTIFESGAMVQYLLDKYGEGRLQPVPGSDDHARYLQWSWFAESTFARPLGEIVNHRRAIPEAFQSARSINEMQQRAHTCLEALDQHIANQPYLLGDSFSAADIMMGYSLYICDLLAPTDKYKNSARYWEHLQTHSGCRTALTAGR